MNHFKPFSKNDILSLTKVRKFETKLGEKVEVLNAKVAIQEAIKNCTAEHILFGIPEDIGIIANHGTGGAASLWPSFLNSFLNIQSNDFLSGEEIAVIGYFDFQDLKNVIEQNAYNYDEKIDAYRHAVNTIDEEVEELAKIISNTGKIPVAIGGGHNNSYPLIKGCAKGLFKSERIPLAQINCVNLDAHADFRPLEGRHSGNGFRYAEEDGFLEKYCVVGIHENYLPQNVWIDIVNNPFSDIITYEDIFIHEKRNFIQALAHAAAFTEDNFTGIELDLDSIQNTLSSAETPSGILPLHARQYINFMAANAKAAYLHICEGACELSNGRREETTGKMVSYLVTDFIKESIQ